MKRRRNTVKLGKLTSSTFPSASIGGVLDRRPLFFCFFFVGPSLLSSKMCINSCTYICVSLLLPETGKSFILVDMLLSFFLVLFIFFCGGGGAAAILRSAPASTLMTLRFHYGVAAAENKKKRIVRNRNTSSAPFPSKTGVTKSGFFT